MSNDKVKASFRESWKSLIDAVAAANKVMPGCALIGALLLAGLIWAATASVHSMMAVVLIIVVLVSIIVYATTSNYGEAALALVAGMLTVFSVEWNVGRFVAFSSAWSVFSLVAMLIASIKIASDTESILRQASLSMVINADDYAEVEKRLQDISGDKSIRGFGPTERAETLRLFAFRKVDIELMLGALRGTAMLCTISHINWKKGANFIADTYKMFGVDNPIKAALLMDPIYSIVRDAPVSPAEFIEAHEQAKRIALSAHLSAPDYFSHLREGLEQGVPADEMYGYIRDRVQ